MALIILHQPTGVLAQVLSDIDIFNRINQHVALVACLLKYTPGNCDLFEKLL